MTTEGTDRIMRPKEVTKLLGVGRQTLRDWCKAGLLEQPIKLGPKAVGWPATTIQAFLKRRQGRGK